MASYAVYDCNSISFGDIELSECDPEEKLICLRSNRGQEVSISGWQLFCFFGDNVATHTFKRDEKVDARAPFRISMDDFMTKGLQPKAYDHFKCVLLDSTGKQKAIRECMKSHEEIRSEEIRSEEILGKEIQGSPIRKRISKRERFGNVVVVKPRAKAGRMNIVGSRVKVGIAVIVSLVVLCKILSP